jgi:hypothetical protein
LAAAAAAPRKTIEKLFVLHGALADNRTSKADVVVLAVLVENTNKQRGYCWGAVSTIAAVAGASERTVQRTLMHLEQLGYVVVDPGGGGPGSTNHYYVRAVRVTPASPIRVSPTSPLAFQRHDDFDDPKGDTKGEKGDKSCRKGDTALSPDPTDLDPSYKNPSVPTAHAQSARATLPAFGEKKARTEDGKNASTSDPTTSLPDNQTAFLSRVERRLRGNEKPAPTREDCDRWMPALETLAADYAAGAIGGQAERLYEDVAAYRGELETARRRNRR